MLTLKSAVYKLVALTSAARVVGGIVADSNIADACGIIYGITTAHI